MKARAADLEQDAQQLAQQAAELQALRLQNQLLDDKNAYLQVTRCHSSSRGVRALVF